jgi:hypothetical protein
MAYDPARLAEQFIRRMDARGVRLDYAPQTLAFLPLRGELAGYYGEVVRRHLGGAWEQSAEPWHFPRLRLAQDLVIVPLDSAQRVAQDEPEALAREFGELVLGLDPASPMSFEGPELGLLVRWLARRGRLRVPLLDALEESPELFHVVLEGRLTSTEVTLEADRFLRAYVPDRWPDDLARADGDLEALLDQRWEDWHATG